MSKERHYYAFKQSNHWEGFRMDSLGFIQATSEKHAQKIINDRFNGAIYLGECSIKVNDNEIQELWQKVKE